MNYFTAMKAVLQLDETVYTSIMAAGKISRYGVITIVIFGTIYALFALYFDGKLMSPDIPALSRLFFIGFGIGVAFLMHAGASLYLWVFTRGAGGRVEFLPMYMNLSIAAAGLWPLAVVLPAYQSGIRGTGLYILLWGATVYGLLVIAAGAKNASRLSTARMIAAFAVCILVVGSMLYIWL